MQRDSDFGDVETVRNEAFAKFAQKCPTLAWAVSAIDNEMEERNRNATEATTRRINTVYVNPPIPIRSFDWVATFDGYEPGDFIGRGLTEAEAIADLRERDDADRLYKEAISAVSHREPSSLGTQLAAEFSADKVNLSPAEQRRLAAMADARVAELAERINSMPMAGMFATLRALIAVPHKY